MTWYTCRDYSHCCLLDISESHKTMNQVLQEMYEKHHAEKRSPGFTVLADIRGDHFKKIVGTDKEVLDIGCRDGALTRFFAEGNRVLGVDIDKNALAKASNDLGIEILYMDLNADWSEIGDRKFDAVTAGEIVEHLFYPDRLFKKVNERLNDEGLFVGSVPNAFSLKNRLRYLLGTKKNTPLSDPTHINHFSVSELAGLLKREFSSVQIIGLGRYTHMAKIAPSLFAFDLLFIARK